MITLVLDTNSAVSGLLDLGAPREIVILAYRRRVQLWASHPTLAEFSRVIRYPRLERRVLAKYLTISSIEREYATLVSILSTSAMRLSLNIEADPDDDEFLRVSSAASAQYLVSRDQHLLDVGGYEGTRILRPSEFMSHWRESDEASQLSDRDARQSRWHVWRKRVVR